MINKELSIAILVDDLLILADGNCISVNPSTGVNTAKRLLKTLTRQDFTVFKFDELYNIELTPNQKDRVNDLLSKLPELSYF